MTNLSEDKIIEKEKNKDVIRLVLDVPLAAQPYAQINWQAVFPPSF